MVTVKKPRTTCRPFFFSGFVATLSCFVHNNYAGCSICAEFANEWIFEWWMRTCKWMCEWMTGTGKGTNERTIAERHEWMNEWINDWVDEWMNEWIDEGMTEWWNKCMSSNERTKVVPLTARLKEMGANLQGKICGAWTLGKSMCQYMTLLNANTSPFRSADLKLASLPLETQQLSRGYHHGSIIKIIDLSPGDR